MNSTDAIRAAVDRVSLEVSLLGARGLPADGKGLDALQASWGALVDALALGPAPQYRACPHCGSTGMRAARICGSCWMKLVPPAEPADGTRREAT